MIDSRTWTTSRQVANKRGKIYQGGSAPDELPCGTTRLLLIQLGLIPIANGISSTTPEACRTAHEDTYQLKQAQGPREAFLGRLRLERRQFFPGTRAHWRTAISNAGLKTSGNLLPGASACDQTSVRFDQLDTKYIVAVVSRGHGSKAQLKRSTKGGCNKE